MKKKRYFVTWKYNGTPISEEYVTHRHARRRANQLIDAGHPVTNIEIVAKDK